MRKVLSALSLFVFCCALAQAQPATRSGKAPGRVARPSAVSLKQPGLFEKIWKQLTGWVRTYDDPPPERVNTPVPT